MTQLLLAVSDSTVASMLVKATLVASLGLLLALALRRTRASVRHTVLAGMFGVLLVLPMIALLAPPLRVVAATAQEPTVTSLPDPILVAPAPLVAMVPPAPARPRGISTAMVLWSAWGVGVAAFLVPMMVGLWQVGRLRRSAAAWTGVACDVELLLHPEIAGPMACGVFRPAIILPRDAESWSEEDVNRALVHEREHLRRADLLTQYVARFVCAVYWFHPLVWIAWRRLVLEAERSCDDAVLAQSEATAYADQLVGLAERTGERSPVLAMADRADLARRVRSVLDGQQKRGRAGILTVALTCAFAAVLVCGVGPLKVVAAPQQPPIAPAVIAQQAPPPAVPVRPAPVPTPQTPAAAPLIAQAQQPVPVSPPAVPRSAVPLSSTTELVVVTIVVTDADGKNVSGLASTNFVVTEDSVPQYISMVEYQMDSDPPYYSLGYYPTHQTHDGSFRRIDVKIVGRVGLTTRARMGYYAESGVVYRPPPSPADTSTTSAVTPPKAIYSPQPEYSDEARRAKWSGTVRIRLHVSETGEVSNLAVVRPLGLGLDEKALEAVHKWKFQPAEKNGQPVAAQTEVDVAFHLL